MQTHTPIVVDANCKQLPILSQKSSISLLCISSFYFARIRCCFRLALAEKKIKKLLNSVMPCCMLREQTLAVRPSTFYGKNSLSFFILS